MAPQIKQIWVYKRINYLLLLLSVRHIGTHQLDLLPSFPQFLDLFEAAGTVVDPTLLTVFFRLLDKLLNILFDGKDSVEDLLGAIGGKVAFVVDNWLVLLGFFLNVLETALNPIYFKKKITDAFPDVLAFILSSCWVIIEHGFQVCVMTLFTGTFVVGRVGEQSIEAKTDQKWFANLFYSLKIRLG